VETARNCCTTRSEERRIICTARCSPQPKSSYGRRRKILNHKVCFSQKKPWYGWKHSDF